MTTMAYRVAGAAAGILSGMVLGIWLIETAIGGDAALWIAFHQAIRGPYTFATPPVGALAAVVATVLLVSARTARPDRRLLAVAVLCLVVGMVVTIGIHFPINAEVDTWTVAAPPAGWDRVHDRWLLAHGVRSVLALAAFVLLLVVATRRAQRDPVAPGLVREVSPTLP